MTSSIRKMYLVLNTGVRITNLYKWTIRTLK